MPLGQPGDRTRTADASSRGTSTSTSDALSTSRAGSACSPSRFDAARFERAPRLKVIAGTFDYRLSWTGNTPFAHERCLTEACADAVRVVRGEAALHAATMRDKNMYEGKLGADAAADAKNFANFSNGET